ncbi:Putative high mobility group protein B3-like protein [Fukomys damarensis]|uniref:Putative high mobility group protein B3-like protein n=1 Tax=Fukomys damarensis TaxID=885580 RepID=A0A091E573_FUKDA|nr:Putative high mobility group protein B3-like protein [Fukomys damarensis]
MAKGQEVLCRRAEKNIRKTQRSWSIFAKFSKKYSGWWKTGSRREKFKFDKMAKADKVHYERLQPGKRDKKRKDPNATFERLQSGFFLFCSEPCPKITSTNPGIAVGDVAKKLGEMWNK